MLTGYFLTVSQRLIKRLGFKLKERVCGSDVMPALCRKIADSEQSVFILGGPPGAGDLAAKKLKAKYPGLKISGVYSPKFGFENDKHELEYINSMLNKLQPNVVFVGLGSPKQENWIFKHGRHLKVGVLLAIGASIEFEAGTVKRAPKAMQKAGFEWLYRAWTEPKRLGKRYLQNFEFLKYLL